MHNKVVTYEIIVANQVSNRHILPIDLEQYMQEFIASAAKTFGINLKTKRNTLGYTQRDLAILAGLGPSKISLIEQGNVNFRIETAERLAWAMNVNIAELLKSA